MARIEVKDFSSNKQLEDKTDEFKSANSKENYSLHESLDCILKELKEVVRQLKKINT